MIDSYATATLENPAFAELLATAKAVVALMSIRYNLILSYRRKKQQIPAACC
jgi:hypothetical protein